ncbi:hypothetical protein JD969_13150 [Planctomycetota bacterium]|nr:hypothetical protein JD969_13150 [Planctomycetota bacterium]
MHSPRIFMFSTAALLSAALTAPAFAHHNSVEEQLQIAEQRLESLERAQNSDSLSERHAAEVKGLIKDVLADADARATLLQDGILAGCEDGQFFLRSADGSFKMNLAGYIQFGTKAQHYDKRDNETLHAFQVNRAKLYMVGTVNDVYGYRFCLATNRNDGSVYMEEAQASVKLNEDTQVYMGVNWLPFQRETMVASSKLLTYNRSFVTALFDTGFSTQLGVKYDLSEDMKLNTTLSNGYGIGQWGYGDMATNDADFSSTTRFDWKLAGDWDQACDYVSWTGDQDALFVGAGVNYERGDRSMSKNGDLLLWTVDALYKAKQWTAAIAYSGLSSFNDNDSDITINGVVADLAYNMDDDIQPYLRYEWLDNDRQDTQKAITFGANYFMNKHKAKLTADVVRYIEGFDENDHDITELRAQFQLAF